jgi:hypothetical protein
MYWAEAPGSEYDAPTMISWESSPASVHPGGMPEVVEVVGGVRVVEVVGADVVVDEVGDAVVDVDVPVERPVVVLVVDPVVLQLLRTSPDIVANAAEPRITERPETLRPLEPACRLELCRLMRAPSGDRSCHQRGP